MSLAASKVQRGGTAEDGEGNVHRHTPGCPQCPEGTSQAESAINPMDCQRDRNPHPPSSLVRPQRFDAGGKMIMIIDNIHIAAAVNTMLCIHKKGQTSFHFSRINE